MTSCSTLQVNAMYDELATLQHLVLETEGFMILSKLNNNYFVSTGKTTL